jgi:hypothetical protein
MESRAAVAARNEDPTRPAASGGGRRVSAFTQSAAVPRTRRTAPAQAHWRRARYPHAKEVRPVRPEASPAGSQRNPATRVAPSARARPAKERNRPAISRREIGRALEVLPGRLPGRVPSGFWTANANVPAVKWPSTADTAFHVTVYTPGPIGRRATLNVRGSDPERFTDPTSTRVPFTSVTRIDGVPPWTASERVIVTRVGACGRIPRSAGSELTYSAWAWPAGAIAVRETARRTMNARARNLMWRVSSCGPSRHRGRSPRPRGGRPRFRPRGRSRPGLGGPRSRRRGS